MLIEREFFSTLDSNSHSRFTKSLFYMGRAIPSPTRLQELARVTTSKLSNRKRSKPILEDRFFRPPTSKSSSSRANSERLGLKMEMPQRQKRLPLSEVVSDCAKRWFQDTLKAAEGGDSGMQVLVGQMYFSGYGVTADAQQGRTWTAKASRNRSSAWDVSKKQPGYNASDSDSDE